MNPAINVALIAAASKQATEQSIEGKLREAGAIDAANAIGFDPDGKTDPRLLDQAIARATVARTADDRIYLDERAVADRKHGQGFMVLVILLIAASLIASGVALLNFIKN